MKDNPVSMKLDAEFEKFLKDFARKNKISMRMASKEIIEPLKKIRGQSFKRKIIEEIRF